MRLLILGILFMGLLLLGCTGKDKDISNSVSWYDSVINDAKAKYPDADVVEIEGDSKIGDKTITLVKVVFNSGSPCPVRMRLKYEKGFGFATGVPTYIVKDCVYKCVGSCQITTEEEAIVAAHSLPNSEKIQAFVENSDDISASAKYDEVNKLWEVFFDDGSYVMAVNLTAKNPKILDYALTAH